MVLLFFIVHCYHFFSFFFIGLFYGPLLYEYELFPFIITHVNADWPHFTINIQNIIKPVGAA